MENESLMGFSLSIFLRVPEGLNVKFNTLYAITSISQSKFFKYTDEDLE